MCDRIQRSLHKTLQRVHRSDPAVHQLYDPFADLTQHKSLTHRQIHCHNQCVGHYHCCDIHRILIIRDLYLLLRNVYYKRVCVGIDLCLHSNLHTEEAVAPEENQRRGQQMATIQR